VDGTKGAVVNQRWNGYIVSQPRNFLSTNSQFIQLVSHLVEISDPFLCLEIAMLQLTSQNPATTLKPALTDYVFADCWGQCYQHLRF
jgi:hypothetical protein